MNFTNLAQSAAASSGWCVYLIHGIDNDGGYSPLPSATLQQVVNFFATNQQRFWVQPFGTIARYIKERDAVSVYETSHTADTIVLSVTNSLDPVLLTSRSPCAGRCRRIGREPW